jgi:putative acetyltransferase
VHAGVIAPDDPSAPDVRALLERHLAFAQANSPIDEVHVLDIEELLEPDVTFLSCRLEGALLAVGALRTLDTEHAELKSMHTAEAARGRGVGRAMVEALVDVARAHGMRRVSIETGATNAFAAALALYRGAGFEPCEPFGQYRSSPSSTCMTRWLDEAP